MTVGGDFILSFSTKKGKISIETRGLGVRPTGFESWHRFSALESSEVENGESKSPAQGSTVNSSIFLVIDK